MKKIHIKNFEDDRIVVKPASKESTNSLIFFDSGLTSVPPFIVKDYRIQFLSYFIKKEYSSILDISCGFNATILKWAKWRGFTKVVGTNIDESAIRQNRLDGLDCIKLDLNETPLHLPFNDNSFDVVVCTEVIEHIKNPKMVINELVRVSKHLCFVTTPVQDSYFSDEHIQFWNNIDEIESTIKEFDSYFIRLIVTKPVDFILNQRSFVFAIFK